MNSGTQDAPIPERPPRERGFFSRNKDTLSGMASLIGLIAQIIQTIAIIVGAIIAFNEFVIKDRNEQWRTVENARSIVDVNREVIAEIRLLEQNHNAGRDPQGSAFPEYIYRNRKNIAQLYTDLVACSESNRCDLSTIKLFFCPITHDVARHYRIHVLSCEGEPEVCTSQPDDLERNIFTFDSFCG